MKINFKWSDHHLFHWLIWLGAFSTRWLLLSVNFWPRSILRGEIMPWMWWFYKYQVLSSELFHHFSFVLLLLPPDVFQIFLPANSRTPETKEWNCLCWFVKILTKCLVHCNISVHTRSRHIQIILCYYMLLFWIGIKFLYCVVYFGNILMSLCSRHPSSFDWLLITLIHLTAFHRIPRRYSAFLMRL